MEGLCQNMRIDSRVRSKYGICYGDSSWVLAAQACNRNCTSEANVELEVNESDQEHKDVSRAKDFGYELIIRVRRGKAHSKCSFKDNQNLSSWRVNVRRV
ncbi:unnamed protein product [Linum trigynum]|uniref:Uncharacterized protein n=1 Tax=Linum trigynum TaxID=586398 RepID=A0AAV2CKB8_9ROSI